jgi:hypothetical protein
MLLLNKKKLFDAIWVNLQLNYYPEEGTEGFVKNSCKKNRYLFLDFSKKFENMLEKKTLIKEPYNIL